MERITSRQNRWIRHLRQLARDRAYRREQGEFLCDGAKLLEEALGNRTQIGFVLLRDNRIAPDLSRLGDVPVSVAEESVFAYASPLENSPGPLFTVRIPEPEVQTPRRVLLLESLQDPGNVGTVIRTANALGIGAVLLVGACADLYHPKTVRATMGAIFRQRVEKHTVASLQRLLSAWKMPLAGAVLSERAENILQTDLTCCACAVGSEGSGLSRELIDLCSREVIIPMQPESESLNAAVAASIIMWEMRGRAI